MRVGGDVSASFYDWYMVSNTGVQGLIDSVVDHDLVLESLAAFRTAHLRREVGLVLLAVHWAKLNPGEDIDAPEGSALASAAFLCDEQALWLEIGARGCPVVDDLTIPLFAASAGLSEFQARKLIRESLLLVHLLPRVWARAQAGQVDVWRVR